MHNMIVEGEEKSITQWHDKHIAFTSRSIIFLNHPAQGVPPDFQAFAHRRAFSKMFGHSPIHSFIEFLFYLF